MHDEVSFLWEFDKLTQITRQVRRTCMMLLPLNVLVTVISSGHLPPQVQMQIILGASLSHNLYVDLTCCCPVALGLVALPICICYGF